MKIFLFVSKFIESFYLKVITNKKSLRGKTRLLYERGTMYEHFAVFLREGELWAMEHGVEEERLSSIAKEASPIAPHAME